MDSSWINSPTRIYSPMRIYSPKLDRSSFLKIFNLFEELHGKISSQFTSNGTLDFHPPYDISEQSIRVKTQIISLQVDGFTLPRLSK
jgi:hypothetical protein